jgi:hypothetical protein
MNGETTVTITTTTTVKHDREKDEQNAVSICGASVPLL